MSGFRYRTMHRITASLAAAWMSIVGLSAIALADTDVVTFPVGSGDGQVGYSASGEDALDLGAAALAASKGHLFVLDRVNQRIISYDATTGAGTSIPLTGVGEPVDLQVVSDKLFVFDASAQALKLVGLAIASPDGQAGSPEADQGAADQAEKAFFHDGWASATQTFNGGPELDSELGAAESASPTGPVQQITAADGTPIVAKYVPSPLGATTGTSFRGELVFAAAARPADARSLVIARTAKVHSAKLLAVLSDGRAYALLTESSAGASGLLVRRIVLEYDAKGKATKQYEIPAKAKAEIPGRSLVVDDAGQVLALLVDEASARVVSLSGGALQDLPTSTALPAPPLSVPLTSGTPEANLTKNTTTPTDIIVAAAQFWFVKWKVPAVTMQSQSSCDPAQGHYWSRPAKQTKEKLEISGLPYCWGCGDSIDSFLDGLAKGKVTGNICTKRDCPECIQPDKTIGVDCSGFVSNVWSLAGRVTTSSLPTVADQLNSADALQPGDALNKAGSHVRLFVSRVRTEAGEKVIIYESSVTCGGVCMRTVDWADLEGYLPYRRKNLAALQAQQ